MSTPLATFDFTGDVPAVLEFLAALPTKER